ncbi:MAG TPA: ferritin-like domain-containing protein [Acidobacteriaceae bacterium]|jgi:hypothetical protein|nr:ferritin-like domain-containing protein [Acidobacteriaceae bacterium]
MSMTTSPPTSSITDTDILNFALNLEYLEAEFFLRASTGSGLSAADAGTGAGAVTGGTQISGLTAAQSAYLNEIAQTEMTHVRFLRQQLGSAAVARPAIDFTAGFNGAASAAGLGSSYNPFANGFNGWLIGAFTFEDVGVSAYTGAAPLISSATILNAAASIQAVEAYHAGAVRTNIVALAAPAGADQTTLNTANAISKVRATLGGGMETTLVTGLTAAGVVSGTSGSTIVAASTSSSIGFARTPSQVLHIVYETASAGVSQGGFFPSGLNGTIKTTA